MSRVRHQEAQRRQRPRREELAEPPPTSGVPVCAGASLETARETDARWRIERTERHAERVRRLRRWVEWVNRMTTGGLLVSFAVSLCVMIGSLAWQTWIEDARRPSVFRLEVAAGIALTVVLTLAGAFCETVLRWRLRQVMERGWRDGIELGD